MLIRLHPNNGVFTFVVKRNSSKWAAFSVMVTKEREELLDLAAEFFSNCRVSAEVVVSDQMEKISDHIRQYEIRLTVASPVGDQDEFEDMINDFANALRKRSIEF